MKANPFQATAIDRISDVLRRFEISPVFVEAGLTESFLVHESSSPSLQIWVYQDELGFTVEGLNIQFEHQDYDSQEEMLTSFLIRLEERLSQHRHS